MFFNPILKYQETVRKITLTKKTYKTLRLSLALTHKNIYTYTYTYIYIYIKVSSLRDRSCRSVEGALKRSEQVLVCVLEREKHFWEENKKKKASMG